MALTKLEKDARAARRTADRLGKEPFVGTGKAAELCKVKKPNLGRLIDSGRLRIFQQLPAGPIFLRLEVEVLARELERERRQRAA